MSYYGTGDYYQAGGIFGSIWSGIKTVAGAVGSVVPNPVSGAIGLIGGVGGSSHPAVAAPSIAPTQRGPSRGIALPRFGPPTAQPTPQQATRVKQDGTPYKRRRMNVANAKALRRAIRREQGFVKLAKKALKGTGYRITTKSSSRQPRTIVESGSGSVITR